MLASGAAGAIDWPDYQIHGFAAQGFAWSDGNDVLGNSRQGSFKFYEAALNGSADFGHGLLASAQGLVRRAGRVDDGAARLDYGLLDYEFLRSPDVSAGLRVGKVRNELGFFNSSRDVVFARPGILLPDSIYGDLSGQQRSLLFSAEGAQLYGDLRLGEHELSLNGGFGRSHWLDNDEKRLLFSFTVPFDSDLHQFWHLRLLDDIDGGRWQVAGSYLHARIGLDVPSFTARGDFDIDLFVLSGRFNASAFSLTSELTAQRTDQSLSIGGSPSNASHWSDGGYLQGDWRFLPHWSAMARFDSSFADRKDRDGSQCPATGMLPYQCYSYDGAVGLKWLSDVHWGIWGELHRFDGVFERYSSLDNQGRVPAQRWNLFLLMAAYRF
jgi:hypothetical protein